MGNVSRGMEILRKGQKEKIEIKNIVTAMKNAFDGLISRLDTAEETIFELELECMSIETSKVEKQREKRLEKKKK